MNNKKIPCLPKLVPSALGTKYNLLLRSDYFDCLNMCLAELGLSLTLSQTRKSDDDNKSSSAVATGQEIKIQETVIHVAREDALRLTIVKQGEKVILRETYMNIGKFLHNDDDYQPSNKDLLETMTFVYLIITRLLKTPSDSRYIFPILCGDEMSSDYSTLSFWEFNLILANINFDYLHEISHAYHCEPKITPKYIQIGGAEHGFEFRFKKLKNRELFPEYGAKSTGATLVRITMSNELLTRHLEHKESIYGKARPLITGGRLDMALAIQEFTEYLNGFYLHVPKGSPEEADLVKAARLVALVSRLRIDKESEYLTWGQHVFASSRAERMKFKKTVAAENATLVETKLRDLFTIEVLTSPTTGRARDFEIPINPVIAAAYYLTEEPVGGGNELLSQERP